MTGIGVIADVHGNLAALEAVLAALGAEDCDELICLGDVAAFGPQPAACVDVVRARPGIRLVQGNTDRYIAEERADPAIAWCADRLGQERIAWLADLPTRQRIERFDGLAVHASPRGDEERLPAALPDDELDAALAGTSETLVVHGHTHEQYERRLGARRVANPGAVGMPFDGDQGAAFAVVDEGGVHLRRAVYDVERTIAALAGSDNPARDLIARRLREARE